jgi:signal peptidase I
MNSRSAVWLVGSLCTALFIVAAVICLRVFVLNLYHVPTGGMAPTIRPGDVVWAYKLAYSKPSDVRRGDMVVHRARQVDGSVEVYVKRVIGIAGDRVRTFGREVFVNGMKLAHQHRTQEGAQSVFEEQLDSVRYLIWFQTTPRAAWSVPDREITVPAESFFLLGDNRTNSLDSRYTGCIEWSDIVGKIVWPAPHERTPDP